jgi:hypothetical protein
MKRAQTDVCTETRAVTASNVCRLGVQTKSAKKVSLHRDQAWPSRPQTYADRRLHRLGKSAPNVCTDVCMPGLCRHVQTLTCAAADKVCTNESTCADKANTCANKVCTDSDLTGLEPKTPEACPDGLAPHRLRAFTARSALAT